jgi:Histidine kinase
VLVDEHATRTAEAIADERARIARELHDVVAHAISVIVLQARGGRRMLTEDLEATRSALEAIERAGEQARSRRCGGCWGCSPPRTSERRSRRNRGSTASTNSRHRLPPRGYRSTCASTVSRLLVHRVVLG